MLNQLLLFCSLTLLHAQEDVGISSILTRFGDYAAIQAPIDDPSQLFAALRELAAATEGRAVSLEDLGRLRALTETFFISLTISAQSKVLKADNRSIDEGKRQEWFQNLARDLKVLVSTLPGDPMAIAFGFVALYWVMISNLALDPDGLVRMESYSSLTQAWWLSKQVSRVTVGRICEVGFNAGHSALASLTSAPQGTSIISFDLFSKSYTRPCADFLQDVFPGRLQLIAGPSNETILKFASTNLFAPRCDVVFIDGGHEEHEASSDLLLMSLLSRPRETMVVMDDIGCEESYCAIDLVE